MDHLKARRPLRWSTIPLAERIIAGSSPEPNSGCFLWLRAATGNGYGAIKVGGVQIGAHCAAWIAHNGPIPEGMVVCHKCDVPLCVNEAHLFIGTTDANVADRDAKHRTALPKGAKNAMSKLTEIQVLAIKRDARSLGEIANSYGVAKSAICRIKRGDRWKHVS